MKLLISEFIAFEAEGSDISHPRVDSGYDPELVRELARVVPGGGVIDVGAPALRDLASWLDAIGPANAQGGNPSGARACARLAEKALALAGQAEAA